MKKGMVRWFSKNYGYGFIQNEYGQDIFVHFSVIQQTGYRSLEDGQLVDYEAEVGPKGDYATVVIPSDEIVGGIRASEIRSYATTHQ